MAFPDCVLGERTVSVRLGTALEAGATVRVEAEPEDSVWALQADGTLAACFLPTCDPATGESPDAATPGCETLHLDVFHGEISRYTGVEIVGCEGDWGIVDLDHGAVTCPGSGLNSFEECP